MANLSNIEDILFLDIETVPLVSNFNDLDPFLQSQWTKKSNHLHHDMEANESYINKAAIYAEFGKIVCISCAFLYRNKTDEIKVRIKSFSGHNEKKLIKDFLALIDQYFDKPDHCFCGHNIREFDIPYILRRAVINQINIPQKLRIEGKKPWEMNFLIDTLQLWKFGDYKSYISLDLLHYLILGVPSKGEIDGSMVGHYYYEKRDLKSIVKYCESDVVATIKIFSKLFEILNRKELNIQFPN